MLTWAGITICDANGVANLSDNRPEQAQVETYGSGNARGRGKKINGIGNSDDTAARLTFEEVGTYRNQIRISGGTYAAACAAIDAIFAAVHSARNANAMGTLVHGSRSWSNMGCDVFNRVGDVRIMVCGQTTIWFQQFTAVFSPYIV